MKANRAQRPKTWRVVWAFEGLKRATGATLFPGRAYTSGSVALKRAVEIASRPGFVATVQRLDGATWRDYWTHKFVS